MGDDGIHVDVVDDSDGIVGIVGGFVVVVVVGWDGRDVGRKIENRHGLQKGLDVGEVNDGLGEAYGIGIERNDVRVVIGDVGEVGENDEEGDVDEDVDEVYDEVEAIWKRKGRKLGWIVGVEIQGLLKMHLQWVVWEDDEGEVDDVGDEVEEGELQKVEHGGQGR